MDTQKKSKGNYQISSLERRRRNFLHLLLHCLPVIRMLVEVVGYLNGFSFGVRGNVSNFTEKWVPYVQNRCGCHNLLHIPCIRKHFFLFFFSSSFQMEESYVMVLKSFAAKPGTKLSSLYAQISNQTMRLSYMPVFGNSSPNGVESLSAGSSVSLCSSCLSQVLVTTHK